MTSSYVVHYFLFTNTCANSQLHLSVCKFISRGNPLGDETKKQVKQANIMVARVCLLALLATSRGLLWIIEQPCGSLMEKHPSMQFLFEAMDVFRKTINMSELNAGTQKRTWLYRGHKLIDDITHYTTGSQTKRTG